MKRRTAVNLFSNKANSTPSQRYRIIFENFSSTVAFDTIIFFVWHNSYIFSCKFGEIKVVNDVVR